MGRAAGAATIRSSPPKLCAHCEDYTEDVKSLFEGDARYVSFPSGSVVEVSRIRLSFESTWLKDGKPKFLHGIKAGPHPRRYGLSTEEEFTGCVVMCRRFFAKEEVKKIRRQVEDHLRKASPEVAVRTRAWLGLR